MEDLLAQGERSELHIEVRLTACDVQQSLLLVTATDPLGVVRSDIVKSQAITFSQNLAQIVLVVNPDVAGSWSFELQLETPPWRDRISIEVAGQAAGAGLLRELLPHSAALCSKIRRSTSGLTLCERESSVEVFRQGKLVLELPGRLLAAHRDSVWIIRPGMSTLELRHASDDSLALVGTVDAGTSISLAGAFEDSLVFSTKNAARVVQRDGGALEDFPLARSPFVALWSEGEWWSVEPSGLCPMWPGECRDISLGLGALVGFDESGAWFKRDALTLSRFSPLSLNGSSDSVRWGFVLESLWPTDGIEGAFRPVVYRPGQREKELMAVRTAPYVHLVALPAGEFASASGDFWIVHDGPTVMFLPGVMPEVP